VGGHGAQERLPLVGNVRCGHGTGLEDVVEGSGVEPVGRRDEEALREGLVQGREHEVRRELRGRPGSDRPGVKLGPGHRGEHRPHRGEHGGLRADHGRDGARLGQAHAAGHGRVGECDARRAGRLRERAHCGGSDGAHHDVDVGGRTTGEQATFAEQQPLGRRRVGQHAHRHLGLGEPRHIVGHLDPYPLQSDGHGASRDRRVVRDDLVTGDGQMASHRTPHPAETGEPDLHDVSS
jgi:hypothetical protein